MDDSKSMLDLAFFRTGALRDTPAGALFVPAVEGGERFLAGRLDDVPVLVALEGQEPFRLAPAEQWARDPGLLIEKIRFQVDKASAFGIRQASDAPNGALLLSGLGAMIVAYDHDGSRAVLLGGGMGSTDLDGVDPVAFTNWQIVAGSDPSVVMYRSPQVAA